MRHISLHRTGKLKLYLLTFLSMEATEAKKILIVEDDETISTLYRTKFEKEWYIVKICTDGMEAVTRVMDFAPDFIFLDIMMPSMDGFETLRVVRELAPSLKTKIIMFSNLNRKTDIDRCMELGADAYLLKADTTPADALRKMEELFFKKPESEAQENACCIKLANYPHSVNSVCPNCGTEFVQEVPLN